MYHMIPLQNTVWYSKILRIFSPPHVNLPVPLNTVINVMLLRNLYLSKQGIQTNKHMLPKTNKTKKTKSEIKQIPHKFVENSNNTTLQQQITIKISQQLTNFKKQI